MNNHRKAPIEIPSRSRAESGGADADADADADARLERRTNMTLNDSNKTITGRKALMTRVAADKYKWNHEGVGGVAAPVGESERR